jgi:IS30 family transposase
MYLERLARRLSHEQIAGRLRHEYPDDMRKRLSGETIYVALYVLPHGALRQKAGSLVSYLSYHSPLTNGHDGRYKTSL